MCPACHQACYLGRRELVAALMAAGADPLATRAYDVVMAASPSDEAGLEQGNGGGVGEVHVVRELTWSRLAGLAGSEVVDGKHHLSDGEGVRTILDGAKLASRAEARQQRAHGPGSGGPRLCDGTVLCASVVAECERRPAYQGVEAWRVARYLWLVLWVPESQRHHPEPLLLLLGFSVDMPSEKARGSRSSSADFARVHAQSPPSLVLPLRLDAARSQWTAPLDEAAAFGAHGRDYSVEYNERDWEGAGEDDLRRITLRTQRLRPPAARRGPLWARRVPWG